ncbi:hypothetical protein NHQ30_002546 [Ciborinia camelliae]|nr:hypothetical protein NHQ30_002546 [Ciborinia camelliae]
MLKRMASSTGTGSAGNIKKTRIRPAETQDLDSITKVYMKSLATETLFRHRFPYREEYADEHEKYSRLYLELVISEAYPDFLALVLEVEEDEDEDDEGEREKSWIIAAFSTWDLSYVNRRLYKARGGNYVGPARASLPPLSLSSPLLSVQELEHLNLNLNSHNQPTN